MRNIYQILYTKNSFTTSEYFHDVEQVKRRLKKIPGRKKVFLDGKLIKL